MLLKLNHVMLLVTAMADAGLTDNNSMLLDTSERCGLLNEDIHFYFLSMQLY